MLLVDTNILIDAANSDSEFHGPCLRWLERQRRQSGAWYTTWPVLYEFLRVSTHPRVMQRPWSVKVAWQFVTALLASPGIDLLVPTDKHAEIASQVIAEIPQLGGNLMHDAHTAILMREHGIKRICTRDMDFRRFPFLEIVDPSREER